MPRPNAREASASGHYSRGEDEIKILNSEIEISKAYFFFFSGAMLEAFHLLV